MTPERCDVSGSSKSPAVSDRDYQLHRLRERVKELMLLHVVAHLFQNRYRCVDEVLEELVRLLPTVWRHSEVASARLVYGPREICAPGYRDTPWKLVTVFSTPDGTAGQIEVCYLEERPGADEGPFLREERDLLDTVGAMLASFLEARAAEEALLESERRFRLAVENIPNAFVIYDRELRFQYVNALAVQVTGIRPEEFLGRRDEEMFPPEMTRDYLPLLQRAAETRMTQSGECRIALPNGQVLMAQVTYVPVLDSSGEIHQILGITHDLTQRKQMEGALRESEEMWRRLAETLPGTVYVCRNDARYSMLFLSPPVEELTGYPREDFLSDRISFIDLFHPEDLPGMYEEVTRAAVQRRPFRLTYRIRHRNGQWRWVDEWGVGIYDGAELKFLHGFLADATARKEAEAQLVRAALHDPLTRIGNRTLLVDHLEHALHRCHRREDCCFAILFIDLDGFKAVNDSLGHLAGDQVLQATAERIQSCIRPGDTAARFAGDEFTVLLDDLRHPDDAIQVAHRILEKISQPICAAGRQIHITASLGIAIASPVYGSAEEVLRDADAALYQAKAAGKSRVVVFEEGVYTGEY